VKNLDNDFENLSILYLISHSLYNENNKDSYQRISNQVCTGSNIEGCSIWKKEEIGQQRLAYTENDYNEENIELSNLDYKFNRKIINTSKSVTLSDLSLKNSKYKNLNLLGIPVVFNKIFVGSFCLYYRQIDGIDIFEKIKLISDELGLGIYQFGRGIEMSRLESLKKELEKARVIQQVLLPEKPPVIQGIKLAGRTLPTYEISGDYYDFIITEKNKFGIVIADVMGKGIPAFILMAVARTVTRSVARRDLEPEQVLSEINNNLYSDLAKLGMFLTMFYALYNPINKLLSFSSAGHNPPIILSGLTGKIDLLRTKGIFIGGSPETKYKSNERILQSGDMILFYTDGLIEAKNNEGKQFGIRRVAEALKEYSYCDLNTVVDCLCMKVKEFVNKREQKDDITLVLLKVE
jgi:sigma-B regulation protein RsbU (phosphoserine phosphatase)